MQIVSIHAHPDDAEILAGGTLSLLAGCGHEITIVTMTAGDCGSDEYGPDETARIRKEEAAAAARLIGARYLCAGFSDLAIFNDDQSRRRVTALLRGVRPDIVLTASPIDYHCDHEATSSLVRDACFAAPIPNYSTGTAANPLPRIPHLYFMDPLEMVDRMGVEVKPDLMVDVSGTFETKERMLAMHETQRGWLRAHHGMDDYLVKMRQWTEKSGARAGIALGEGFRQYLIHPYPQSNLLKEALPPNCVIY